MEEQFNMIFYFTATGNSLYVAKEMEAHPISIAQAIHDKEKVYCADQIGMVCPVYGHEMPELVKEFLKVSRFETGYFYILLTYGNRHGGAAELAKEYVEGLGLHPAYINVVLMADNFLPGFDMEEQKRLDKKVDEQISRIHADIVKRKIYISPVTEEDRNVHRTFLAYIARMGSGTDHDLYEITDECIGCGICTKVCPKKCFHLEGQKSIWNSEGCISCMACIHSCPMKAIRLKMPEKNPHARYRNENISLCEIVEANNQWGNGQPQ